MIPTNMMLGRSSYVPGGFLEPKKFLNLPRDKLLHQSKTLKKYLLDRSEVEEDAHFNGDHSWVFHTIDGYQTRIVSSRDIPEGYEYNLLTEEQVFELSRKGVFNDYFQVAGKKVYRLEKVA